MEEGKRKGERKRGLGGLEIWDSEDRGGFLGRFRCALVHCSLRPGRVEGSGGLVREWAFDRHLQFGLSKLCGAGATVVFEAFRRWAEMDDI